ncbi:MAG: hypothetical protein Q4G40_08860 [Brachybacterium sp.]|nr:hypothetical protein [Brachybacterium sp.]
MASYENVTLREQLHLDRRVLRLALLMLGLSGFGAGLAMIIESGLGAAPWDVLHVALAQLTGASIGTVVIVMSLLVLLAWIPLRQSPGIGTLANALWVGVAIDATLAVLPTATTLTAQTAMLLGGILLNGAAGAVYIGALLGPGPRDGVMTGLHLRFGLPIAPVRIGLEVLVLATGWLLGGPVGLGTLAYALLIGPITHLVLPHVVVPVRRGPAPTPFASQGTIGS